MIPNFRAWNSRLKLMLDVKTIDYIYQVVCVWNKGLLPFSFKVMEILHGTGYKDMTGAEVFEGDIIEFDDTRMYEDDSYGETNEVTGGETSIKNLAVLRRRGIDWRLEDYKHGDQESEEYVSLIRECLDEDGDELSKFLSRPSNFKIVGNIYQNKDLLEERT